jgi:hypothetical protein
LLSSFPRTNHFIFIARLRYDWNSVM